tara:strand:+ start:689 stop:1159 length:471 start_codon:yes stop_codon:yes gene_type:complete
MKIKENFISQKDFENLSSVIISSHIPYYFKNNVAHKGDKDFYFTHELFNEKKEKSRYFDLMIPVLDKLKISTLLRVKVNCFPSTKKIIKYGEHVDFPFKHNGAIFYINTCDGGTWIKDKFIQSISNRILLFDSNKPHQSTNCTDKKCRFNININYL